MFIFFLVRDSITVIIYYFFYNGEKRIKGKQFCHKINFFFKKKNF